MESLTRVVRELPGAVMQRIAFSCSEMGRKWKVMGEDAGKFIDQRQAMHLTMITHFLC